MSCSEREGGDVAETDEVQERAWHADLRRCAEAFANHCVLDEGLFEDVASKAIADDVWPVLRRRRVAMLAHSGIEERCLLFAWSDRSEVRENRGDDQVERITPRAARLSDDRRVARV